MGKNLHVVWWVEHLRDGDEEGAKVVGSLEEAEELILKMSAAPFNLEFRVFALSREVPLRKVEQEIPQPSRKVTVYKVR